MFALEYSTAYLQMYRSVSFVASYVYMYLQIHQEYYSLSTYFSYTLSSLQARQASRTQPTQNEHHLQPRAATDGQSPPSNHLRRSSPRTLREANSTRIPEFPATMSGRILHRHDLPPGGSWLHHTRRRPNGDRGRWDVHLRFRAICRRVP